MAVAFFGSREKTAHACFVCEYRRSVNVASGNLWVARQDHLGVFQGAGTVRGVAGHASHFNERRDRIGESSEGTNQIQRFDVMGKLRPALEAMLARDN